MKPKNQSDQPSTQYSRPSPKVFVPFVGGVGFIILAVGLWKSGPLFAQGFNLLIPYGFSVLLLLLGMATIGSCFYQLALRRIPPAVIDVSTKRLRIDGENKVTLTQPGRAHLSFLRLRLLCIEQKMSVHKRASRGPDGRSESYTTTKETNLHQQTLIEVSQLDVQEGMNWEETKTFTIPSDAKASRESDLKNIVWRLELSGRSGFLMRFSHTFEVSVG